MLHLMCLPPETKHSLIHSCRASQFERKQEYEGKSRVTDESLLIGETLGWCVWGWWGVTQLCSKTCLVCDSFIQSDVYSRPFVTGCISLRDASRGGLFLLRSLHLVHFLEVLRGKTIQSFLIKTVNRSVTRTLFYFRILLFVLVEKITSRSRTGTGCAGSCTPFCPSWERCPSSVALLRLFPYLTWGSMDRGSRMLNVKPIEAN